MRRTWFFVPDALPIAPQPHHDKLMSSWLRRVAMANWFSLGDLLEALREADESMPALRGCI